MGKRGGWRAPSRGESPDGRPKTARYLGLVVLLDGVQPSMAKDNPDVRVGYLYIKDSSFYLTHVLENGRRVNMRIMPLPKDPGLPLYLFRAPIRHVRRKARKILLERFPRAIIWSTQRGKRKWERKKQRWG